MENIMLDMIFFIQNDVATGLKFSFEDLGKNGLAAVAGENVEVVLHWVLEVNLRLKKVRQILTKISIHFFEDLIFCSVSKFKELFSLLLDQERVTQLNIYLVISNTRSATMVHVKAILIRQSPTTIIFALITTGSYKDMQSNARYAEATTVLGNTKTKIIQR